MKNKILPLLSLLAVPFLAHGQNAWSVPAEVTDPTQSVTLYVDLAGTYNGDNPGSECQNLVGTSEPFLYIWAWIPNAAGVPGGDWGNYIENEALRWTKEDALGPDVYSFTMVPTTFYGVTAQQVYDGDIHFLVRALVAGSGGCGGGEQKSGDCVIRVDPPFVPVKKVRCYPKPTNAQNASPFRKNDVFTVVYDRGMEANPALLAAPGFVTYVEAWGDDGVKYRVANLLQVNNTPALSMTHDAAEDIFYMSFIPAEQCVLPTPIPETVKIEEIHVKVYKQGFTNAADQVVDEDDALVREWVFTSICP